VNGKPFDANVPVVRADDRVVRNADDREDLRALGGG